MQYAGNEHTPGSESVRPNGGGGATVWWSALPDVIQDEQKHVEFDRDGDLLQTPGLAAVFRAKMRTAGHHGPGQQVVIKMLPESERQRLTRECKYLEGLDSRSIIRPIARPGASQGQADGLLWRTAIGPEPYFFLVMEDGGESLDRLVLRWPDSRRGPSFFVIHCIASSLCDALRAVHNKRLVHLDVTQRNIVLQSRGPFGRCPQVKLIDFDIAQLEGGTVLEGPHKGKPALPLLDIRDAVELLESLMASPSEQTREVLRQAKESSSLTAGELQALIGRVLRREALRKMRRYLWAALLTALVGGTLALGGAWARAQKPARAISLSFPTSAPTSPPATSTPWPPATPRPTRTPTVRPIALTAEPTSRCPLSYCRNPRVQITQPVAGQRLQAGSRVPVYGVVNLAASELEYHKLEWVVGDRQKLNEKDYHFIVRGESVISDESFLGLWDLGEVPDGPCWLSLRAVDRSGHYGATWCWVCVEIVTAQPTAVGSQ